MRPAERGRDWRHGRRGKMQQQLQMHINGYEVECVHVHCEENGAVLSGSVKRLDHGGVLRTARTGEKEGKSGCSGQWVWQSPASARVPRCGRILVRILQRRRCARAKGEQSQRAGKYVHAAGGGRGACMQQESNHNERGRMFTRQAGAGVRMQ